MSRCIFMGKGLNFLVSLKKHMIWVLIGSVSNVLPQHMFLGEISEMTTRITDGPKAMLIMPVLIDSMFISCRIINTCCMSIGNDMRISMLCLCKVQNLGKGHNAIYLNIFTVKTKFILNSSAQFRFQMCVRNSIMLHMKQHHFVMKNRLLV